MSDLHQIFGASYRGPTHSGIITHSGRGYITLFWRRCDYTLCTSGFMDGVIICTHIEARRYRYSE